MIKICKKFFPSGVCHSRIWKLSKGGNYTLHIDKYRFGSASWSKGHFVSSNSSVFKWIETSIWRMKWLRDVKSFLYIIITLKVGILIMIVIIFTEEDMALLLGAKDYLILLMTNVLINILNFQRTFTNNERRITNERTKKARLEETKS